MRKKILRASLAALGVAGACARSQDHLSPSPTSLAVHAEAPLAVLVQSSTGSPIPSAMVRILIPGHNGQDSAAFTRISDNQGRLTLPPLSSGEHLIDVRAIGHKRLRIQATAAAQGLESMVFTLGTERCTIYEDNFAQPQRSRSRKC